jgi:hypothetical protein
LEFTDPLKKIFQITWVPFVIFKESETSRCQCVGSVAQNTAGNWAIRVTPKPTLL